MARARQGYLAAVVARSESTKRARHKKARRPEAPCCRPRPTGRAEISAVDLEQARAALAAADAHGHDAPFGLAATAFLQQVAGEAGAGHAEGMADRDRAAIDVVLLGIDAELVARIEALAGKRLVEFPEVDVADLQPVALQQLRHRVDRSDTHFVRLAAG